MKKITNFFLACLLVVAVGTGTVVMTSAIPAKKYITIKIKNTTTFNIDQIFISPDNENHWGNDILDEDEVLTPGEVVTVTGIDAGMWDVKLVAEDDSECIVQNIKLADAALWNVTADCGK